MRRIVENEASAPRNLLTFLRERRITRFSIGVKLYPKVRLLLFWCAMEVRAINMTYLKLGKCLEFRKTLLFTTVPITSNGRLDERAWFKNGILQEFFEGGVHTLR